MALVPYGLARAFLFGLDPETAHDLTIASLSLTQRSALKWSYANTRVEDPVKLAGLTFPNRVGLAAGLDKNARCIDGLGAMGFGFVEVGTVTPLAQPGNAKPRLFRLPAARALINRFGFNNDGLQAFIANVQQSNTFRQRNSGRGNRLQMLIGLNIGKNAATPIARATSDYLICLDGVYPFADYVTVNISSPNTKNLRSLQGDDALDALLSDLSLRREALAQQHNRHVPIFLKIAPDLDAHQIDVIADTLRRYGCNSSGKVNNAWGVIATNTTLSRDAVQGLLHADEAGGLSGTPVLDMSNRVVRLLRTALGEDFPIIGVGGIMSAEDAVSKIQAGADLVQIYTGLIYSGPTLVTQAAQLLKRQAVPETL
ncbi:MAG: dihydroorotate dehydrogenase (quinone) [Comamonadaceae bacterium CG1_02_60_18]|nr:MAG: dihydroorotate dehydrogenase (quinone) [Comamonadaceae bacterium CG1_02_60_18]PIQ53859.1 MAG: dihydroorotate dehydrogenase (quinone) [Comamonadaceae bacterium CG12_big_fil_rev_8_21_14_0_65_59_15]